MLTSRSRLAAAGRRALLAVAVSSCLAATPLAGAAEAVPTGYHVTAEDALAPGVAHEALRRDDDPEVVHVARMQRSSGVSLRVVLAENRLGAVERTDALCLRVGCVAAVNGDFYLPGDGLPVGGLVVDGQLLKSPVPTHNQLSVAADGTLSTATLSPVARLVGSDLQELRFDAVNAERGDGQLVLYTPAFGPSTLTNQYGSELVARVVEPAGPLLLGQTALVELLELQDGTGNAPIPADGVVLSGHGAGAAALASLWARAQSGETSRRGLLRLEMTPGAQQSIGGGPVLVRDGRRFVGDDGSDFVHGRHPRTVVGWTAEGEVLLVTVDGRQPGYSGGMSLAEAADLMVELGAVEALNLDGGGSTTFVAGGRVLNQPSDRLVRTKGVEQIVHVPAPGDTVLSAVQRPVAMALAIVPDSSLPRHRDDLLAGASPQLPVTVPLRLPGGDPGSIPGGSLPARVATLPGPPRTALPTLVAMTATALTTAAGFTLVVVVRQRRNGRRSLTP
ncbi:MAG TPA: phosphodiester glycosidase family protein [Acidimicrobiales bacterium]|nr:phosphodiester glycosidase family protein [Acidimicrobiales bacterium]